MKNIMKNQLKRKNQSKSSTKFGNSRLASANEDMSVTVLLTRVVGGILMFFEKCKSGSSEMFIFDTNSHDGPPFEF